jgi:hypothetical protein
MGSRPTVCRLSPKDHCRHQLVHVVAPFLVGSLFSTAADPGHPIPERLSGVPSVCTEALGSCQAGSNTARRMRHTEQTRPAADLVEWPKRAAIVECGRDFSDQIALIRPSWVSAVTPSSRPISATILPLMTFSTVVPVKCILWPVAAGRAPKRKSLKAGPV